MLGAEALVALTQSQALSGLDEAARTFGVFLEIHRSTLLLGTIPEAPARHL